MNSDFYTKIFLFRHSQTVNTLDGVFRYNGFLDIDVEPNGLKIFEKYIPILKKNKISRIYSSDLIRARKGAEVIAKALGLTVYKTRNLREVKQGVWEGLSYEEIQRKFPEQAKKKFEDYVNFKVKGAENLCEASERVNSFVNILLKKHKNENIAVFAHGGANMLILLKALNMQIKDFFRLKQDFGCMNEINYFENFAKVIRMNYLPF